MALHDIPQDMTSIEISTPGGADVLRPCKRQTPLPAGREVLIKVAAAGVNRPDVLQRMGLYPPPPGATDIPGLEVAGHVVAIGDQVDSLKPGDEVCALLTGGGYAEYAIADAGSCLPVPRGLSLIEAAGLPETAFTVWANVFDDARLEKGERLLVHGGTSGIGVMAIAMARAIGAKVFATAGSREKCESIKNLGADAAYHYGEDQWETEIQENGGVDVVLDMAGGDFLARNLTALNTGGRHVSIAFLRGAEASINIFDIMRKQLRLTGSTMKSRSFEEKKRLAEGLHAEIWPKIADGTISATNDEIFPLEEASRAHQRMEAGDHIGKIILTVGV